MKTKAVNYRGRLHRVTRRTLRPVKSRTVKRQPVIELVPNKLHLGTVLVPTDFSESSRKALHYAVGFAEQFGAGLVFLHVVEPVVYPAEMGFIAFETPVLTEEALRNGAKKQLQSLVQGELRAGIAAKAFVRVGSPYNEIVDAARELKVDLIILATHGYTGLKHVLLGSTAERVVRHAPCPVLTVRQKEHGFVK